nr:aldehyde ferredoxin oxidoreductase N-terminal domain-containing protein [Sedimentibacter sp.]
MSKICYINLTTNEISYEDYNIENTIYHGRSLTSYLVNKCTSPSTDRFDDENVIVLTPGLFTGTTAPSTGRISVATKKGKGLGMQIINMTGALPQKIASLGFESLIISGKSTNNNSIIYIDKNKIEIKNLENCNKKFVSEIISEIKATYGDNCAIMGTGPAANNIIPLSTMFSTYPEGYPQYYCTRNGFGDIFGSKNLKAIIVNHDKYFQNKCFDKKNFSAESKKLAKLIISNPICGQALPGHGSITLIKLLKNKENIPFSKPYATKVKSSLEKGHPAKKINKTCAPLCVIGCLNRHCRNDEEAFSAPAESEVNAALSHCYNIEDILFSKKINTRAFELGIDSTEFVFSSNLYFKAINKIPSKDDIYNLLTEIENNTILGKIIGSKTQGIYNFFRENQSLEQLVTKPVINEEKNFNIVLDKLFKEFENIDDLELMYRQIFLLSNLGFCIFTAFALINNKEALNIISDMYYYKTGQKLNAVELINFADKCIKNEIRNEKNNAVEVIQKNIPEFTKVLYRYFSL